MPATKRRPGRPTIQTRIITDKIFKRIAHGESLRTICKDKAMPARSTVYRWLARSAQVASIRQTIMLKGWI